MNKSSIIALVAIGLTSASSRASSYVSDFSGLGVGDSLAGVDGWQQNEPNYNEDGIDYPWAFGTEIGTGQNARPAAAVGGYYNTDTPESGSFYAYHTISFDSAILFNMNFAIMDSEGFMWEGDLYGTERNSFRIGLNDGGTEIFSLVFDPNIDPENPDPLVNSNDTWNVSVSSGGIKSTASMAIYESQLYALSISLVPDAENLEYSFSLTSSNTLSSSGTLAGLANAEINQLQIGIDPLNNQFGDNHIVFEGMTTAIPEPSALLLVGLAAGCLVFRRRRQLQDS